MGPLGWQETIFIFVLALLVFGPKKLPELGKTIGKAMTQFRQATADLKGTWDREMQAMERDSASVAEETRRIDRELAAASMDETYHGTSSSYDSSGDYGQGVDVRAWPEESPESVGATATQGAESTAAEVTPQTSSQPVAETQAASHPIPETIAREKNGAPPVSNAAVESGEPTPGEAHTA
jgi:TatA/E family protein of Tat protein translocase